MNFDHRIVRRGTGCIKWDAMDEQFHCEDMIPMWVADMDFPVAEVIQEALKKRIMHPVYGYVKEEEYHKELFANHFNEHQHHQAKAENVILSTGVVYSINACVQRLTEKGDRIMIHSPAYPPFRRVVNDNDRVVVDVAMKVVNHHYELDFEKMEEQAKGCKMFILCNPQNPTGRVFDQEELTQLADFCERHQMLVISDEIHSDFVFEKEFIPFAMINEYTKKHTITCVSCTKTFNLAALNVSAMFIYNKELYDVVDAYTALNGLQAINAFGLCAMQAAYEYGQPWLDELLLYLQANRDYAYEYIQKHLPKARCLLPDATYLLWIDLSAYGNDIHTRIAKNAKVYTNDGNTFGEYDGYIRFNIACPRMQLEDALNQLYQELEG